MVSLTKNQGISLAKENIGFSLGKVRAGLGWDQRKENALTKLLNTFTNAKFDLDAFAFLLDSNGKLRSRSDIVYFNGKRHKSGTVIHHGDNLTGEGEGDDEVISVDLQNLPAEYSEIIFCVNIFDAKTRKQHFGMVENAFIRLVNDATNEELCRFDLTKGYNNEIAIVFARLYRVNGNWEFQALGDPIKGANTVFEIANLYM